MEMVGTSKPIWVFSSIIYLYIDFIFFFMALISANRILAYLLELEEKQAKRNDARDVSVESVEFDSSSGSAKEEFREK